MCRVYVEKKKNLQVQTMVRDSRNMCPEYGMRQSGRKVWGDRQKTDYVKSCKSG